jgi:hypothetical protein
MQFKMEFVVHSKYFLCTFYGFQKVVASWDPYKTVIFRANFFLKSNFEIKQTKRWSSEIENFKNIVLYFFITSLHIDFWHHFEFL